MQVKSAKRAKLGCCWPSKKLGPREQLMLATGDQDRIEERSERAFENEISVRAVINNKPPRGDRRRWIARWMDVTEKEEEECWQMLAKVSVDIPRVPATCNARADFLHLSLLHCTRTQCTQSSVPPRWCVFTAMTIVQPPGLRESGFYAGLHALLAKFQVPFEWFSIARPLGSSWEIRRQGILKISVTFEERFFTFYSCSSQDPVMLKIWSPSRVIFHT